MPFVPVPDVIEVQVRFTNQGENGMNTFYYRSPGTITQTLLDNLTAAISAQVVADWTPILSQSWVLREIYARDLSAAVALQSTDASDSGADGALTGVGLASFISKAIARRSGFTGRGSRGRLYWAGLDPEQVDNNVILPTPAAQIVAAIENTDAEAVALGLIPVIVSKFAASNPLGEAVVYTLVDWLMTDLFLDTRRSRKRTS